MLSFLPVGINRLVVWLQLNDVKGKYTIYQWMTRYFSKHYVSHKVGKRRFKVPLKEWCFWLEKGPNHYYLEEFDPLCDWINGRGEVFTLFDLGADIGTVSSLIESRCAKLGCVVAFEPNPGAFSLLMDNLNHFYCPRHIVPAAISDFTGTASFVTKDAVCGDHEGHLESKKPGSTAVFSLDDWIRKERLICKPLVVLKVDVEGQEIAAIHGAKKAISSSKSLIIFIEIHPEVLAQNGQEPEDIFNAVESHRDVYWVIPKLKNKRLDRAIAFYDQVPRQQYDLMAISCS